jgi:hypothetical protein
MASGAVGMILAAGAITAANEAVFAPVADSVKASFNWRIVPATVIAALLIDGLDRLSPAFAIGLAATALITVLFTQTGKAPAPAENLDKILGYTGKVT